MLTEEEKQVIINILSQLQFKVGQSLDMATIEEIVKKLSDQSKETES